MAWFKVYDVIFVADEYYPAPGWVWNTWRHEYRVHPEELPELVRDPVDDELHTAPWPRLIYRYIRQNDQDPWKLIARQANFVSDWGPAFAVLK